MNCIKFANETYANEKYPFEKQNKKSTNMPVFISNQTKMRCSIILSACCTCKGAQIYLRNIMSNQQYSNTVIKD